MKHRMIKFKDYLQSIWLLTKRNNSIFLKNKTTLLFSMLAPALILAVYVLFMGDMQTNAIKSLIDAQTIEAYSKEISGIAHAWMISGILGISALTIALNSMFIAISDRERGIIDDFTASPVRGFDLTLSYFISAFIITFIAEIIFLVIGVVYIFATTNISFTFLDYIEIIGIIFLSTLSAVIFLMCLTAFFKKTSTASSFTGIFSALIGFLIGAYLPVSILPTGIQNFANIIPGSHATGLFRMVFMNRMLERVPLDPVVVENIKDTYGFNLQLFGLEITRTHMYIYLSASIVIFFVIFLVIHKLKSKLKR